MSANLFIGLTPSYQYTHMMLYWSDKHDLFCSFKYTNFLPIFNPDGRRYFLKRFKEFPHHNSATNRNIERVFRSQLRNFQESVIKG